MEDIVKKLESSYVKYIAPKLLLLQKKERIDYKDDCV